MKRNAGFQPVSNLSCFCCFVSSVKSLQHERWSLRRIFTFAPVERQIVSHLLYDLALKCPPRENFGMAIANTLSVASLLLYEHRVGQKLRPHSESKDEQVIANRSGRWINRFIAIVVALDVGNNGGDAGLSVGLSIALRDGPLVCVQRCPGYSVCKLARTTTALLGVTHRSTSVDLLLLHRASDVPSRRTPVLSQPCFRFEEVNVSAIVTYGNSASSC